MNKLGKFAAACAAVVCAFGANGETPATYYKYLTASQGNSNWTVLDWKPTGDSVIETKWAVYNGHQSGHLFSAHGTTSTENGFSCRYGAWNYYYFLYGGAEKSVQSISSVGAVNDTKFDRTGFYVGGSRKISFDHLNFTAGNQLMLFANYATAPGSTPVASGSYGNYYLYTFSGYDDGGETLKVKLYPCKDANGKFGLYDLVNRKIYYNLGSGKDFSASTEVPGPLAEINVLSADGRRYGTVSPAYGTTAGVDGETYGFTAPEDPVSVGGSSSVRATCTGWKLYSAADNSLIKSSEDEGEVPTSFTHMFSTSVGAIVEWQWKKAYRFTVEKVGGGAVSSDATAEWFDEPTAVTAEAVADEGYEFVGWSGVPEAQKMVNPVTVEAGTAPLRLVANFAPTAAGEQTAVYVRADAQPGGDGTCWARAFADFRTAVTNANELKLPVYAAKGVYTLTSSCPVTGLPAIYGGFLGTDDAETIEDRQSDVNKTVLSGDRLQDNYWCHVVPGAAGSHTHTKTEMFDKPLFVGGELQLPPAFTADYDTYLPNIDATDTSAALSITATAAGTIDGLWFAGFCGSGNAIVTYNSGTKAMNLVNCRFIGNTSQYGCVRNSDTSSYKKLVGCKFMFTGIRNTASWGDSGIVAGVNLGSDGTLTLQDCDFLSLSALGGSGMNNVWTGTCGLIYGQTYHYQFPCRLTLRGCTFARGYAYQPDGGNRGGGANVLNGNTQAAIRVVDCVMSNCLTVAEAASAAVPDFGRSCLEAVGCTFANNRHDQKGGSCRTFFFLGGSDQACRQYYTACSFVGNEYNVTSSSLTDGTVLVTIFATPTSGEQKSAFVNCVFDDNKVSAKVQDGVTVRLCRGVMAYCTTANLAAEVSIAGCTFVGPRVEGVKDVVMYNANYNRNLNIVDSIFEYTTGEPYDGFDFMNPASAKLYSCTLANWVRPDVEFSIEGHAYDYVPFVTNYVGATRRPVLVPAANPPHLRETADLAYNGATFSQPHWMTNYAFRAYGSTSWQALTSSAKTLDADVGRNPSKYVCTDAVGAVRPYGATTRGAVQGLTETAENGVTLTLRREPFEKGVLAGPQVQAVATDAATVPVTATATDPTESPFIGWYDENDDLYSPDATLAIESLGAPLTLTAKFAAKKSKVVFDLGEHATFDETGLSTNVIELAQGADFPEVPPFTVEEGWIFANWKPNFPVSVPDYDIAFTAKVVTASLRTMRVAADSTAAEPDGLSWETAYRSVADAYADAAICRGEVWIKEGVYTVPASIPMGSNVVVRGGFVGGETSADEADPAHHPTVLTGDVNKDSSWKKSGSGTYQAIIKDGVVQLPDPNMTTDLNWACAGAGDDTYYCFNAAANVENVGFYGLTFASFNRAAIRDTLGGSTTLVISNCLFVGCCSGGSSDYAAVQTSARETKILDSAFLGNYASVKIAGSASSFTNEVANCRFDANIGLVYAAGGVTFGGNGRFDVYACDFTRHYANQDMYDRKSAAVYLSLGASATADFADCLFSANCVAGLGFGAVGVSGNGSIVFERARFVGNFCKNPQWDSWNSYTSAPSAPSPCFTVYHSGKLLVRDSYFGDNTLVGGHNDLRAAVCASLGGETTFVNCTVENCEVGSADGQPSGVFAVRGSSKLGIVNCLVRDCALTGTNAALVAYYNESSGATVGIVNSAFLDDLPMFRLCAGATPGLANSYIANVGANALATAYCYNLATNGVVSASRTKEGDNGALAAGVKAELRGRPVWEKDNSVYFYDEIANPEKPWRKVADKASFAASVTGLSLESDVIPDAYGAPRRRTSVKLGPVNCSYGLTVILR